MLSIIGTIDDIIIINRLIKDNQIDNEIKLLLKFIIDFSIRINISNF